MDPIPSTLRESRLLRGLRAWLRQRRYRPERRYMRG